MTDIQHTSSNNHIQVTYSSSYNISVTHQAMADMDQIHMYLQVLCYTICDVNCGANISQHNYALITTKTNHRFNYTTQQKHQKQL